MMDLRHAATALGGEVTGRASVLCPGAGHSPRDRSLSVTFAGERFTVHSFAGDHWQACRDYVRERLGFGDSRPRATSPIRPAPAVHHDDDERSARALALWCEARLIEGTPAAVYLASRGVSYEGEALRWHPSCPFGKGERMGAMVALVRNVVTDEPVAIHRTAIGPDGRKLAHLGNNGRLSLGPVGGGAVKLSGDANVTAVLAIGEGIETTLSIRELPDLRVMPLWSMLSANGVAAFPVLPGIEAVWIAADNDASGTGQHAAQTAAARLVAADKEVIIITPTKAGADLNDTGARHAHG